MVNFKVLEGDLNCIGIDLSDISVGGFQRVLEFVVVVELDIGFSFFDVDEFQSVLSEFLLRIGFISKRFFLRIEFSKVLFYIVVSGLLFFFVNSWGSGDL